MLPLEQPVIAKRLVAKNVGWEALSPKPGFNGWTDDFASIVPVLRPIWGPRAP